MKRKTAAILCTALCTALLLTGCGAGKEEPQAAPSYEETAKTEPQQEEPAEPEKEQEPEVEEPEAQEEIIEDDAVPEDNDSPFAFEIEDPVIYDEEGVTVTLDEWNLDGDSLSLTCSMTNNNPDNKKVNFRADPIIDDFDPFGTGPYGTISFSNLAVGENDTNTATLDLRYHFQSEETIGIEPLPINSLSFSYQVQIGSDSEAVLGRTFFKNPEFTEDDFSKVYGDKIDEFECDGYKNGYLVLFSFEVYLKHTENDYTLITLKRIDNTDCPMSGDLESVNINDKQIKPIDTIGGSFCIDGGIKCYVFDTPENIRKEYEISNDVPLEGYIYTNFPIINESTHVTDYVTIPGTLE